MIRLTFKVTNQAAYGSRQRMHLNVEALSKPTSKNAVKAFVRALPPWHRGRKAGLMAA